MSHRLKSTASMSAQSVAAAPRKARDRQDDPRLEAARKRLRESVGQADTLEAIREIIGNLLGCEEIGLFSLGQANEPRDCGLVWSFGIDPQEHKTLAAFDRSALERALQGEIHVTTVAGDGHDHQANRAVRAFIPIRRHGRIVAVLVMVRLLPQKLGLDEADINLVNLLSDEAGRLLFDGSANDNA
ncbi:MAG TPA: GAF domain-containing protein [Terriglobales bacterium]|nr:GAF domain-containing protein [Terriglobales bacterium]